MPVTVGNGTVTPVVGTETDVAFIAPGTPLDNLSVYVVGGTGGGGGPLEFALYATVGGFRTRVAQKMIRGDDTPSIIDWDTGLGPLSGGSGGAGQTEQIDAGGTTYTVTVIDLSAGPAVPRNPVSVTIAGVDSFDTALDANFGQVFSLAPGATGTLPVFPGYAQLMDVAIDQGNLPPVTVTVAADCGPGSVLDTVVVSVDMTGRDDDIATVFRGIKLPVATRYFVSVSNNSNNSFAVTLTGITYSVSITAGGAVILNGDVIGPSNNNIVIKWDNVPLLLVGLGNFGAPVDAAIPIFDAGLGVWRNFALSGDATMDNAGLVTINPAFVNTLAGNVNGPSNANRWTSLVLPNTVGTPATIIPFVGTVPGDGWWYVAVTGVTVNRTVDLPAVPTAGEVVVITDEGAGGTAFLTAGNTITVNGNGPLVEGVASFVMTSAYPGPFGSICLQFDGTVWSIFADYAQNAPSSAQFTARTILGNNADVPAAAFTVVGGWWFVRMINLAIGGVDRTVNLPAAPLNGEVVVVKDGDGSLGNSGPPTNIIVNGNGNTIDGAASYTMTGVQNGIKGSITLQFDSTAPNPGWFII